MFIEKQGVCNRPGWWREELLTKQRRESWKQQNNQNQHLVERKKISFSAFEQWIQVWLGALVLGLLISRTLFCMLLWAVSQGLLMLECVPFAESTRQLMLRFLKLARRHLNYCISLFWSSALADARLGVVAKALLLQWKCCTNVCIINSNLCPSTNCCCYPFVFLSVGNSNGATRNIVITAAAAASMHRFFACFGKQDDVVLLLLLLSCHASSPTCLFKSSPLTTIQARWSSLFTRPNAPSLAEPQ